LAGILFVDSRVADLDQLLAGLDEALRVDVLDPLTDGVGQIAAALDGLRGLDSIHSIPHRSQETLRVSSSHSAEYTALKLSVRIGRVRASHTDR